PDRALVVAAHVVRHAVFAHPAFDAAVAVDVVVPAVAGARLRIQHPFAVLARGRQVRQFRAVDHHQFDPFQRPRLQRAGVGQGTFNDVRGGGVRHCADASIAPCAATASSPTDSKAARTRPRSPPCRRWPNATAGPTNAPTTPTWTRAWRSAAWATCPRACNAC